MNKIGNKISEDKMVKIDLRNSKDDVRFDSKTSVVIDGIVYGNLKYADEQKGELWYFPDLVNYPFTMKVVKGKFENG